MSAETEQTPDTVTAQVEFTVGDWRLKTSVTVSTGPMRVVELLPLARSLSLNIVDFAVKETEAEGKKISCKAGCGACCRQLVPITQFEARQLRDYVNDMPEPRRTQIRERFAEARRRLEAAGLLEKLQHGEDWSEKEFQKLGLDYFYQGIPCPFLEDESCSIYPERPLVCREYLVTTPATACAHPGKEFIDTVRIPLKVWTTVARFSPLPPGARFIRWVPLILALEWADAHPEEPPTHTGPELVEEFFEHLTGKQIAGARGPDLPFSPASTGNGADSVRSGIREQEATEETEKA